MSGAVSSKLRLPRLTSPYPLYPLLLAAYAVLFLYSTNLGQTTADQVLPVLLISVAVSAVLLVGMAFVLKDWWAAALLLAAGEAVFFGYRNVAIIVRHTAVAGRPMQIFFAALLIAALVLVWRRRDWLRGLTRFLNVGIGILVLVTLISIVPHELSEPPAVTHVDIPVSAPLPPGTPMPDIYYLIFDRYGSEHSLDLLYGIKEHGLVDWLEQHGFYVAHDSHANYHRTELSLVSTLNMSMIDDFDTVNQRLQDHAVGRFLKGLGYKYIHIGSWFPPTKTNVMADTLLDIDEPSPFAVAMHDSTLLPKIQRLLGLKARYAYRDIHHAWSSFGLQAIQDVETMPGPKFVFAHILLPHPAYIYDRNGNYLTHAQSAAMTESQAYLEQKLYLDKRAEGFLAPLMALPEDKRPIIIVQSDEGPYPAAYQAAGRDWDWVNASDDDINGKFGILNAQYWPGQADTGLYQTISSVNTFRALFSRYFNADLPLLPDRSLAPSSSTPGGFLDVTDRLMPGR